MSRRPNIKTPGSRVSAHDVARAAGVSQSAVSRALSNSPGVSKETRERIFAIAEQLNYRPNALASGLITQRSGLIGVVVSDMSNSFLTDALETTLKLLRQDGRQALIFSAESDAEVDAAAFEFGRYRVDGSFVICPHLPRPTARKYSNLGPTVLLFNRFVPGLKSSRSVSVDNYAAGAMVADHLIDRGHRSLAYMHGLVEAKTDQDRFKGFCDRLAAFDVTPLAVARGNYSYNDALAAAVGLLDGGTRPTAIFCANDVMAMGVADAARYRLRMGVPDDLAIVGFDDAPPAAWPSYELTTVRQPVEEMVRAGMDVLLARMSGKKTRSKDVILDAELIVRATT